MSQPGTQGCAVNPLAAKRCVLQRQGFSSSLLGNGWGNLSIYSKTLATLLEKNDWMSAIEDA